MAVTILDIAKETGKTYSTVSRALNNCGRMGEETRKQILEVAERLGYRPNFAGVVLQKGRTNTIGVLLPELGNPFYAELLHHLKEACSEKGYDLAVYDYEYNREQERHLLQKLYTGFCDGIFAVVSSLEYTGDLLERLWKAHVPVTLLGTPQHPDFPICYDYVSVEYKDSFTEIFNYLAEHGRRHVVKTEVFITEAISERVKDAISGIHAKINTPMTLDFYDLSLEECSQVCRGKSAFREIMKQHPETDVIIARNDIEVYGMLAAARDEGIRVPDELMFVSCDNTWLNQYSPVPTLTMDQHVKELAEHGAGMLFRRIHAKKWNSCDSFIAKTTTIFPK